MPEAPFGALKEVFIKGFLLKIVLKSSLVLLFTFLRFTFPISVSSLLISLPSFIIPFFFNSLMVFKLA